MAVDIFMLVIFLDSGQFIFLGEKICGKRIRTGNISPAKKSLFQ